MVLLRFLATVTRDSLITVLSTEDDTGNYWPSGDLSSKMPDFPDQPSDILVSLNTGYDPQTPLIDELLVSTRMEYRFTALENDWEIHIDRTFALGLFSKLKPYQPILKPEARESNFARHATLCANSS